MDDYKKCISGSNDELDMFFQIKNIDSGVKPKGFFKTIPSFKELTTMKIGSSIEKYVEVASEDEFINTIKELDNKKVPLLVIGAGSNIVASEEHYNGAVIRDVGKEIKVIENSYCTGAIIEVTAGYPWDELVDYTVAQGWSGLECLSAIPGTVGACPVQNIGAYGVEVEQFISKVITYDRVKQSRKTFAAADLNFGYRTSILKTSRNEINPHTNKIFGYTGRYIVLKVEFQFLHSDKSVPIKYKELANYLGVEIGQKACAKKVREAVINIRSGKGTCLNSNDPNTQSVGSYFINPIVSCETLRKLDEDIPIFDVYENNGGKTKLVDGVKKISAAKLIEKAGFTRGYGDKNGACISDYHVLILTNRGNANATKIRQLASEIIKEVKEKFGIELEPEPVYV